MRPEGKFAKLKWYYFNICKRKFSYFWIKCKIMTKVLPFKIPKTENDRLICQEDTGNSFYNKLHQHPEIQVSLIVKGEGTFIVGDHVGAFKKEDIFVIGAGLPHVFKSDENEPDEVKMISIYFTRTSFGEQFFDFKEFEHMEPFFKDSALGFRVLNYKEELVPVIKKIRYFSEYLKFKSFLDLLGLMALAKKEILSSPINTGKYNGEEGRRMQDIFQYTMQHFSQNIRLKEVADIANMSTNAFCRYFKQRTNKSYVTFLNDIKVGNACKLLVKHPEMSIAEVAERSGFNNIANFNRRFKETVSMTPSAYRKSRVETF